MELSEYEKNYLRDSTDDDKKVTQYDDSELREWLEYKNWNQKEALCLLSDIEPTGAKIWWHGYDNYDGVRIDLPRLVNAELLSERSSFYDIPYIDPEDTDLHRTLQTEAGKPQECISDKNRKLRRAEKRLQETWIEVKRKSPEFDFFTSGDIEAPYVWLDWAKSHQIAIPWLDWAEKQGLIKRPTPPTPDTPKDLRESNDKKDPEGSPVKSGEELAGRKERTYLNIIAGLLGILFGKTSYGKSNSVFNSQTDVINELLNAYPGKQGIKKRTLEEKFAEAKKSLED